MKKIAYKIKELLGALTKKAELTIIILEYLCLPKKVKNIKDAKNIIIVGGELFNKGAQAMAFTTIDQLKQKFPDKNIYLFSTQDFKRTTEEKNSFTFEILPWRWEAKVSIFSSFSFLFKKTPAFSHLNNALKAAITQGCFFIDISGYALSSQWSVSHSMNYLLNIMIAKKFSIPYYIFPQSIGPFDYRLRDKIFLSPLVIRACLNYPTKIFAREEEGLRTLSKFTVSNIRKSCDIVFTHQGYNAANIYKTTPRLQNIKIEPNSVGIIPNLKVTERAPESIYKLYHLVIEQLIKAKKIVYLLRHSYEDLAACQRIKSLYPDNQNIRLISDDIGAIELENIIKQMDFLIASRYHSIIHAYKNGVPVLAIGWAAKYYELLKEFNQLDYFFDIRQKIDAHTITNKLQGLLSNYIPEKGKIAQRLSVLAQENIFDCLYS